MADWSWLGNVGKFLGKAAETATKYKPLVETGVAALSTYAAYKDQKRKNELQQAAYDDYMAAAEAAGREAEAAVELNLTPMTISGTPTTKAEVTDYTAATGLKHGGISGLRKGYARGPEEFEVEQMDEEEVITPNYLMKEEGVNIGPQVFYNTGRGDRANALMIWDQMSTPDKSIFDFDFELFFQDGGWRDMIKGEAPGVQENMKMASAPSMEDSRNDLAMQMFNKPYEQLNELEIEALNEYNSGLMAKGGIAGLRKKYAYGPDVEEVEMMDEEFVGDNELKMEEGVQIGPMAGPDWYIKRIEHLEFLGYDYEEASRIAFDDDEYYSIVGMESAVPRGGDPERPPIYLPKPDEDPANMKMAGMGGAMEHLRYYGLNNNDIIEIYQKWKDSGTTNSFHQYVLDTVNPPDNYAKGGRIRRANGGIMDLGGLEKDYRFSGGFVPIGEYEKKDDVPARLSKNEFVFTADAVRAAGGGSINKGAKRMYETMKHLEAQPTAKRMTA
jgi:hypothetical protein